MKKLGLIVVLIAVQIPAFAQLVMSFTGGDDLSVGPGTAGYQFTTGAQALTIRSLGIWASSDSGLFNAHSVGIWDATTHSLLSSASIQSSTATKIGQFWYVNVTPLTLQTGHQYVIGASYADSDFDMARGNVPSVTMGGGVTLGDALLSLGTGFTYPNLNVSGANDGFFGPNAGFAPVPEPAAVALAVGVGLIGFAAARRRYLRALAALACVATLHAGPSDVLAKTPRAELPAVAVSLAKTDPAAKDAIVRWVLSNRPAVVPAIENALDPIRPPVTPGTDNGNRPVIPPGIIRKYATP